MLLEGNGLRAASAFPETSDNRLEWARVLTLQAFSHPLGPESWHPGVSCHPGGLLCDIWSIASRRWPIGETDVYARATIAQVSVPPLPGVAL